MKSSISIDRARFSEYPVFFRTVCIFSAILKFSGISCQCKIQYRLVISLALMVYKIASFVNIHISKHPAFAGLHLQVKNGLTFLCQGIYLAWFLFLSQSQFMQHLGLLSYNKIYFPLMYVCVSHLAYKCKHKLDNLFSLKSHITYLLRFSESTNGSLNTMLIQYD